MVNIEHYTYRVTWSAEDGEFVGLCAEFPSLSHLAETQAEAMEGILGLIKEVAADMLAQGELLPQPLAEHEFSGKFQIRIPPEIHRFIAIRAAEAGISLNRYVSAKLSG